MPNNSDMQKKSIYLSRDVYDRLMTACGEDQRIAKAEITHLLDLRAAMQRQHLYYNPQVGEIQGQMPGKGEKEDV